MSLGRRCHLTRNLLISRTWPLFYAKRYAPAEWKKATFGVDIFDIRPYLDRIRASKDDLEFFEIEAEYVASLQDSHSGFFMTSSFQASLGITVDIYEGKVLIDSINRAVLPQARYPFSIGDEVVSVDEVPVEDLIAKFSKWRAYGNPIATRRNAAAKITVRSQSTFPRAVEVGENAIVAVRGADGNETRYTIPWNKSGVPLRTVGPVPTPRTSKRPLAAAATALETLQDTHNYRLPEEDPLGQPVGWGTDTTDDVARKFILGQGSRAPIFSLGLPISFVRRLGGSLADFHYSGTYKAGDLTIGYLRIPSFAPPSTAIAVRELETEIAYSSKTQTGWWWM